MRWSIGDVARLSGVTSRTLRHYDAVGLLPPAATDPSGRRHYELDDLLRLQQILLLRRLGLGLDVIAEILDQDRHADLVVVLRRHRAWLQEEGERLAQMVQTVDRTIAEIERGGEMTVDKIFEGFEHNPYEQEARERWGDEAVEGSKARMAGWSGDDAEKARTGYTRVHQHLAPLLADGVPVDDERVQALIQLHFEVTCLFWTPNAEAYKGLGDMYVEDERFHQGAAGGDPAVAVFLRDAMHVFADRTLDS